MQMFTALLSFEQETSYNVLATKIFTYVAKVLLINFIKLLWSTKFQCPNVECLLLQFRIEDVRRSF